MPVLLSQVRKSYLNFRDFLYMTMLEQLYSLHVEQIWRGCEVCFSVYLEYILLFNFIIAFLFMNQPVHIKYWTHRNNWFWKYQLPHKVRKGTLNKAGGLVRAATYKEYTHLVRFHLSRPPFRLGGGFPPPKV